MTRKQNIYINLVKRPVGFVGALLALVVTSPIMLVTTVVLYFANRGGFRGVFFTQERPGKGERIFNIFKFKSMTDECDAEGNLLPDKDRMTRAGAFVRKTSIDELPQLINILKGDMAFIGPRPLRVHYLPLYSEEQRRRHDVLPGISGWAQVNGRNNVSWTEKFKLDVWYVDHISLRADITIFFRTIKKVFKRDDVYKKGSLLRPFDGTN